MKQPKRKVVYITGTRAEYGLMKTTLEAIKAHPKLQLELIVTGTHLSKSHGHTIDEIRADGFTFHTVRIPPVTDAGSMTRSFGVAVTAFARKLRELDPDIVLIEADRYEALAGAIAAAMLGFPVAHVSGGDVSGSLDDAMRHAITKFAHIHLPGTRQSAERLVRMGEERKRIFLVGTPGIERSRKDKDDLARRYGLNPEKPFLLVLQHPVTQQAAQAGAQMRETLEAVKASGHQAVIIYPNNDPGSVAMVRELRAAAKVPTISLFKSIPRDDFLGLLGLASVMIGNSSAGLTEAPLYDLPVINIGSRQQGRERGKNVHDAGHDSRQILKLIHILVRKKQEASRSPYTGEKTGEKIAEVLAKVPLRQEFLEKRLTY